MTSSNLPTVNKTIGLSVLLFLMGCNVADSQQGAPRENNIKFVQCSDGGGWGSLAYSENGDYSLSVELFSSMRTTKFSVLKEDNGQRSVKIQHEYRDGSKVIFEVNVEEAANGFISSSMVNMDYPESIRDEISSVWQFYNVVQKALQDGLQENETISCRALSD